MLTASDSTVEALRAGFSAEILSKQEMQVEAEAETELVDANGRGPEPALRDSEDAARANAGNQVPASNTPDSASKLLEASVHDLSIPSRIQRTAISQSGVASVFLEYDGRLLTDPFTKGMYCNVPTTRPRLREGKPRRFAGANS
jgi:hypothetical protein